MNIRTKILACLENDSKTPEYLKSNVEQFKKYSLSYIRKSLKQLVKEEFILEASGNNKGYVYSLGFYIPIVNPFLLQPHKLKINDTFILLEDVRKYKKKIYKVNSINKSGQSIVTDENGNNEIIGENVKVVFVYDNNLFKS